MNSFKRFRLILGIWIVFLVSQPTTAHAGFWGDVWGGVTSAWDATTDWFSNNDVSIQTPDGGFSAGSGGFDLDLANGGISVGSGGVGIYTNDGNIQINGDGNGGFGGMSGSIDGGTFSVNNGSAAGNGYAPSNAQLGNGPISGPTVFSGTGIRGGAEIVEQHLDDSISKERDLKVVLIGWTNFALSIAALLAVIAIIWAGILYITSLGDDGATEKAKKIILWALGGIFVIGIAYALVNTVISGAF